MQHGHKKLGQACAVSRSIGLKLVSSDLDVLCIDSYKGAPNDMWRFRVFNPFNFDPDVAIPVPRQKEKSHSIEGVWQGLKIVDGNVDFGMFRIAPYHRPPEYRKRLRSYAYQNTTFLYGNRIIGLIEARFVIYLPTYLYMLEHLMSVSVLDEIFAALCQGRDIAFFDWDSNHDIMNATISFSHSAILAAWFNGLLDEAYLIPARQLALSSSEESDVVAMVGGHLVRYRQYLSARASMLASRL